MILPRNIYRTAAVRVKGYFDRRIAGKNLYTVVPLILDIVVFMTVGWQKNSVRCICRQEYCLRNLFSLCPLFGRSVNEKAILTVYFVTEGQQIH